MGWRGPGLGSVARATRRRGARASRGRSLARRARDPARARRRRCATRRLSARSSRPCSCVPRPRSNSVRRSSTCECSLLSRSRSRASVPWDSFTRRRVESLRARAAQPSRRSTTPFGATVFGSDPCESARVKRRGCRAHECAFAGPPCASERCMGCAAITRPLAAFAVASPALQRRLRRMSALRTPRVHERIASSSHTVLLSLSFRSLGAGDRSAPLIRHHSAFAVRSASRGETLESLVIRAGLDLRSQSTCAVIHAASPASFTPWLLRCTRLRSPVHSLSLSGALAAALTSQASVECVPASRSAARARRASLHAP